MAEVKYITQLTKEDVKKMLAAGNMTAGRGIKIDRTGDCVSVLLDEDVITDIIWCFIRSGMAVGGVTRPIKSTRGCYNTDPNAYS